MPPGMPAWLQSIAREGSKIPDHGSPAARTVKSPTTVRDMHRASAIPTDRTAQAIPSSGFLTFITAEPAATFALRSSIENLTRRRRRVPSTHRLGGLNSLGGMHLLGRTTLPTLTFQCQPDSGTFNAAAGIPAGPMDYDALLNELYRLERFGIKLGLETITELLGHMGNPHRRVKTPHLTGANGKGSRCAYVASLPRKAGSPLVAVLTRIGLEHTEHLGKTEDRIAREKAGIIKAGCRVVTVDQGTVPVITAQAHALGCPITIVGRDVRYERLAFDRSGQRLRMEDDGKLELRILDDKALGAFADALGPLAAHLVVAKPETPRAYPPEAIARAFASHVRTPAIVPKVAEAVDRAISLAGPAGLVVVTGSIYTAGEAFAHLPGPQGWARPLRPRAG